MLLLCMAMAWLLSEKLNFQGSFDYRALISQGRGHWCISPVLTGNFSEYNSLYSEECGFCDDHIVSHCSVNTFLWLLGASPQTPPELCLWTLVGDFPLSRRQIHGYTTLAST